MLIFHPPCYDQQIPQSSHCPQYPNANPQNDVAHQVLTVGKPVKVRRTFLYASGQTAKSKFVKKQILKQQTTSEYIAADCAQRIVPEVSKK